MCCECIHIIFPRSTCYHNPVFLSAFMLQQAQYCTIIKANNVCMTRPQAFSLAFCLLLVVTDFANDDSWSFCKKAYMATQICLRHEGLCVRLNQCYVELFT